MVRASCAGYWCMSMARCGNPVATLDVAAGKAPATSVAGALCFICFRGLYLIMYSNLFCTPRRQGYAGLRFKS